MKNLIRLSLACLAFVSFLLVVQAEEKVYTFETGPKDKVGTRLRWTIPLKADLSACDGLEFDFKVENRNLVSGFGLFAFHAAGGCHSIKFPVEAEDGWSHIVIRKRLLYNSEHHPDGWNDIERVMIFTRVISEGQVRGYVKNLRTLPTPEKAVAIVYPEVAADCETGLKKGAYGVQERLSFALEDLGVESYYLSNRDLARGVPSNARLVMIPGHETLSEGALAAVGDYLARGGTAVFWTSPNPQYRALRKKYAKQFVCEGNLKKHGINLRELLRTTVASRLPEFTAAVAKRDQERAKAEKIVLAKIAKMPAPAEAYRAMTCHFPWGKDVFTNANENAANLKKGGFTDLVLCVCRGLYASYDSKVLKRWPGFESYGGDALEQAKAACRKEGLKLTTWRCCWITPEWLMSKDDLAQLKAETRLAVTSKGQVNDRFHCPTHPENIRQEIESMVDLAHKGVDGLAFDFIRYMSDEFCYCDRCRGLFEARLGRKVAVWPKDAARDGKDYPAWVDFRADNISHVVKSVSERVRRECPGVRIGVCGFNEPVDARLRVGQDWPLWGRKGWIDEVLMMDYCDSAADFKLMIERQKKIDCGGIRQYPLIGTTCWPDTGDDAWKTAEQIGVLRACGYSGFGIFDFGLRTERIREALAAGPMKPAK